MAIDKIAVLGAGQMGNGITQVAACAGYEVVMIDIKQEFVDRGVSAIEKSLAKLVSKERMSKEDADSARATPCTSLFCKAPAASARASNNLSKKRISCFAIPLAMLTRFGIIS